MIIRVLTSVRIATVVGLSSLLALTACSSGSNPLPAGDPGALAIVVGARSNSPIPQLSDSAVTMIRAAILRKDELFIIGVDGEPATRLHQRLAHHCDGENSCDAVVAHLTRNIKADVAAVTAKVPEADTLGAISAAARSVSAAKGPKQVLVLDNGLQTTGDLPLQSPGALTGDPAEMAKVLAADGKLERSLKDVDITMVGLGAAAPPQRPLSPKKLGQLTDIWQNLLTIAGAKVTIDRSENVRENPAAGLPSVTPVPVDDSTGPEPAPVPSGPTCIPIREDQVGFLRNSAKFVDQATAQNVLRPIAQKLVKEQLAAKLTGTTALPEEPGSLLSLQRAQAVEAVLEAMGVPRGSLTTAGVGTNFAAYPKAPAKPKASELPQYRLVIVSIAGKQC